MQSALAASDTAAVSARVSVAAVVAISDSSSAFGTRTPTRDAEIWFLRCLLEKRGISLIPGPLSSLSLELCGRRHFFPVPLPFFR